MWGVTPQLLEFETVQVKVGHLHRQNRVISEELKAA